MRPLMLVRLTLAALVILVLSWSGPYLFSSPILAQAPAQGRATSTPYTGALSVFDSPGRDKRLQVDRVMDLLGITRGSVVADIGAGSGWFTVRAAKRVAPAGTVYAVDIN